jgi:hypothetical protein
MNLKVSFYISALGLIERLYYRIKIPDITKGDWNPGLIAVLFSTRMGALIISR